MVSPPCPPDWNVTVLTERAPSAAELNVFMQAIAGSLSGIVRLQPVKPSLASRSSVAGRSATGVRSATDSHATPSAAQPARWRSGERV